MLKDPLNKSTLKPKIQGKQYKSLCFLIFLTFNACLSSFYFGYSLVYLNTISYSNVQQSSSTLKGLVMGCIPIGAGIGALLSSILMSKVSRKSAFLITNIIAVIALGIIQIRTLYTLIGGRLIQGVCVGLFSAITPVYINQMLPPSLSGLGALNQAFIAFGQSFSFLLAYILSKSIQQVQSYIYISSFLFLTIFIQTILFFTIFNFNTPKYLFSIGMRGKALDVLQKIYKEENIPILLQNNQMSVDSDILGSVSNDSIQAKFTKKKQNNTFLAIFAALFIAFSQQFSGVNAVAAYGVQIVNDVLPEYKQIIPIIIDLQPALGSILTSYLLTRLGRKLIMQGGCVSIAITLGICFLGFILKNSQQTVSKILIVFSLVLYMFIFGVSLGPVVWLYIPEFVSASVIPFSTLVNWIGASLCFIFFPIIKKMLPQQNPAYLFLFFMIYMAICFPINALVLVQTKNKSRQQVIEEYQQKKCFLSKE